MNEILYYIVGILLAVCAVAVSFIGLRKDDFGASRGSFNAIIGFMTALVIVTCFGAVLNARAEQKHRRIEVREFREHEKQKDKVDPTASPRKPVSDH